MKLFITSCALVLAGISAIALTPKVDPLTPAPKLVGSQWINGKVEGYKAPLTLVHFWTFGCINCRHNLPVYARFQSAFAKRGLKVIGVHTPELTNERDPEQVKGKVKELEITYPVLIDGQNENWDRWKVTAWPTAYLVDNKGQIKARWVGEFGDTEPQWSAKIDQLLKESGH